MTNKQYERKVDALIPAAARIADTSVEYRKAKDGLCGDDVWNRVYHEAMDSLKYENGLIGWVRK
jgi:hypothetical protein